MKKRILALSMLTIITAAPSLKACTFTVVNNSPYKEIFLVANKPVADAVSVSKKSLKSIGRHQIEQGNSDKITGSWFDIFVLRKDKMFERRFRVSIRYCGDNNKLTFKDIANRTLDMKRFMIVDFANPEEAATADTLITAHQDIAPKGPMFISIDKEATPQPDYLINPEDNDNLGTLP
ncbi:MAG: hypothetical protein NTX86_05785 [Candidatus Dependentiae bacterium]|nr:hypothetical protein [Candidatus Dependentiae bacterium]